MPRFFTTDIEGGTAKITGEDAGHISRVLRMRAGEELSLIHICIQTGRGIYHHRQGEQPLGAFGYFRGCY